MQAKCESFALAHGEDFERQPVLNCEALFFIPGHRSVLPVGRAHL
jgi:hypothetical protein